MGVPSFEGQWRKILMDADVPRRLGRLIEARTPEIERRWLEQVRKDVAEAQGVELTQLRDGIPDYLSAMVRLLKEADLEQLTGNASSAWADVAREHGITRVDRFRHQPAHS